MVWHFIGVYIRNRTLHDRLEIRNFFSRVEIFQHSKKNFVSPRGHVISSISYIIIGCTLSCKDTFEKCGATVSPWPLQYCYGPLVNLTK